MVIAGWMDATSIAKIFMSSMLLLLTVGNLMVHHWVTYSLRKFEQGLWELVTWYQV
jgi:TRAP-type C4-dicarboxylate transport system permease large subunit